MTNQRTVSNTVASVIVLGHLLILFCLYNNSSISLESKYSVIQIALPIFSIGFVTAFTYFIKNKSPTEEQNKSVSIVYSTFIIGLPIIIIGTLLFAAIKLNSESDAEGYLWLLALFESALGGSLSLVYSDLLGQTDS